MISTIKQFFQLKSRLFHLDFILCSLIFENYFFLMFLIMSKIFFEGDNQRWKGVLAYTLMMLCRMNMLSREKINLEIIRKLILAYFTKPSHFWHHLHNSWDKKKDNSWNYLEDTYDLANLVLLILLVCSKSLLIFGIIVLV